MQNKRGNFYQEVYDLVAQIPPGHVATYGQLAAMCGRSRGARAVGWAMRNSPMERQLPCHRVVNASGTMAPGEIFGGAVRQREILEGEGVVFRSDGTIDMKRCLWMGIDSLG